MMSLKIGLLVLLSVSATIVLIAGFSAGYGWLFTPCFPLALYAGKNALVMWRERGETAMGSTETADGNLPS
jgi:hypothetical protein